MDQFIQQLNALNLQLIVEGDNLLLKANKDRSEINSRTFREENRHIITFIGAHKQELIDYLNNRSREAGENNSQSGISAMYPLTPMQEGMLFHSVYEVDTVAYIDQVSVELPDGINIDAFRSAWNYLLRNHSILRSGFSYKELSIPVQWCANELLMPITTLDYSDLHEQDLNKKISEFLVKDLSAKFDLSKPPLMRMTLIKRSVRSCQLIWTFHHIILDGWSVSILMQELFTAYESVLQQKVPPAKTEDRFSDFISFIRKRDKTEEQKFWIKYMSGVVPTRLPFIAEEHNRNHGIGAVKHSFNEIDPSLAFRINEFARSHGLTVNTLFQAAWSLLLSQYTAHPDVVFGVTVSGRPPELTDFENRIGLYINTIPLRVRFKKDESVLSWLKRIQQEHSDAREYQYTGLSDIQTWAGLSSIFFDTLLVFENYPVASLEKVAASSSLNAVDIAMQEQTNYPLTIIVGTGSSLSIKYSYYERLIDYRYILFINERYTSALSQLLNASSSANELIIDSASEKEIIKRFSHTSVNYPLASILQLIKAQVDMNPHATALVCGDNHLSYQVLHREADKLAGFLTKKGLEKGSLIGICMSRSPEMVITLLAVLKSGFAYLPIDPHYPKERINYVITDAQIRYVFTDAAIDHSILKSLDIEKLYSDLILKEQRAGDSDDNMFPPISPDQIAYVIYTSGSTGHPKGVMITHGNLEAFINWCVNEFKTTDFDTVYAGTSICFDLSIFEIFYPLCTGRKIRMLQSGMSIKDELDNEEKILLNAVPDVIRTLLSIRSDLRNVTAINMAGEPIPLHVIEQLPLDKMEVRNLYGPTEDTTYSTCYRITEKKPPLIGKPIANTKAFVLDEYNRLTPLGAIGELYLAGDGLAWGYLNKPDLTADKFLQFPIWGQQQRVYRTGDFARIHLDGNIEYLGRKDDQVKVRGFRIEIGEIESTVKQLPAIKNCAVAAREYPAGEKLLVLYIVPAEPVDETEIKNYLRSILPEHMIPSIIVTMNEIPLTPNGKIDKKALPAPGNLPAHSQKTSPVNETEQKLYEIWKSILPAQLIGTQDSFFDIGGHSLKAIILMSKINRLFKVKTRLRDLFSSPTIEALAKLIHSSATQEEDPVATVEEQDYYRVSHGQKKMWVACKLDTSQVSYNIPFSFVINGHLDKEVIEETFACLISRHESLRTVFIEVAGELHQRVITIDKTNSPVSFKDLHGLSDQQEVLKELTRAEGGFRFDLSRGPLVRLTMARTAPQVHRLFFTIHHLITDGWSNEIIEKEFKILYQSLSDRTSPDLTPLPLQYKDYTGWKNQRIATGAGKEYWIRTLEGGWPVLNLPLDFPRPAKYQYGGGTFYSSLDTQTTRNLIGIAAATQSTLYVVMVAVYKLFLHLLTGQQTIVIGTPSSGRSRSQTHTIVGLFMNNLILRTSIHDNTTFRELIEVVRERFLEATLAEDFPYEELLEKFQIRRQADRSSIFDCGLTWSVSSSENEEDFSLQVEQQLQQSGAIKHDLWLFAGHANDQINLTFEYNGSLFRSETLSLFVEKFTQLASRVNLHTTAGEAAGLVITEIEMNLMKAPVQTDFDF